MKQPYNGHESWSAWNVALWIGNDEPLYHLAIDCKRRHRNARRAAAAFVREIGEGSRTPDGARYSIHSVELAISGLG